MRKTFIVAVRYTIVTTLLLGVLYPLAVTALAQLMMRDKADGQLIERNGQVVGSAIIAQGFSAPKYFHPRPSVAGNGYDATSSGASNYAPSNKKLIDRIDGDVAAWHKQNPTAQGDVPVGLITTSGSGLDPDISPADALYQVPMVAAARNISESQVRALVEQHIAGRQFGLLGEPRVNVLELNLALDNLSSGK
jgi:potassium-transporting ATPase KdpC subunit